MKNKRVLYCTALLGWIALVLYFGVGSFAVKTLQKATPAGTHQQQPYYFYDGLSFASEADLKAFLSERRSSKAFPWVFKLPVEVTILIISFSFGCLGSAIWEFRAILRAAPDWVPHPTLLLHPVFGGFIGLMVVFISFVIPAALAVGDYSLRPESLAGLAMFGGLFSEKAFLWIKAKAETLFQ